MAENGEATDSTGGETKEERNESQTTTQAVEEAPTAGRSSSEKVWSIIADLTIASVLTFVIGIVLLRYGIPGLKDSVVGVLENIQSQWMEWGPRPIVTTLVLMWLVFPAYLIIAWVLPGPTPGARIASWAARRSGEPPGLRWKLTFGVVGVLTVLALMIALYATAQAVVSVNQMAAAYERARLVAEDLPDGYSSLPRVSKGEGDEWYREWLESAGDVSSPVSLAEYTITTPDGVDTYWSLNTYRNPELAPEIAGKLIGGDAGEEVDLGDSARALDDGTHARLVVVSGPTLIAAAGPSGSGEILAEMMALQLERLPAATQATQRSFDTYKLWPFSGQQRLLTEE